MLTSNTLSFGKAGNPYISSRGERMDIVFPIGAVNVILTVLYMIICIVIRVIVVAANARYQIKRKAS